MGSPAGTERPEEGEGRYQERGTGWAGILPGMFLQRSEGLASTMGHKSPPGFWVWRHGFYAC